MCQHWCLYDGLDGQIETPRLWLHYRCTRTGSGRLQYRILSHSLLPYSLIWFNLQKVKDIWFGYLIFLTYFPNTGTFTDMIPLLLLYILFRWDWYQNRWYIATHRLSTILRIPIYSHKSRISFILDPVQSSRSILSWVTIASLRYDKRQKYRQKKSKWVNNFVWVSLRYRRLHPRSIILVEADIRATILAGIRTKLRKEHRSRIGF